MDPFFLVFKRIVNSSKNPNVSFLKKSERILTTSSVLFWKEYETHLGMLVFYLRRNLNKCRRLLVSVLDRIWNPPRDTGVLCLKKAGRTLEALSVSFWKKFETLLGVLLFMRKSELWWPLVRYFEFETLLLVFYFWIARARGVFWKESKTLPETPGVSFLKEFKRIPGAL